MKSTPNSRSSSKNRVTNGRVSTESNRSSHCSEESLGAEEVGKSKKELKQQSVYLLILKQIAERKKTFPRFLQLPPELRCMIYSMLPLEDRVMAVKACTEMATYFEKNRLEKSVSMALEEENGKAYVRLSYGPYVEMYRIPQELVASVESDLASSCDCNCVVFCCLKRNSKLVKTGTVRYLECTTGNMSAVFDTFTLIKIKSVVLKTAPVGGLVDLVQPAGLHREPVELHVYWHMQDSVRLKRDDPDFVTAHWARWIDYLHPADLHIWSNISKERIYVPKDFYDLHAVHNVKKLIQYACNGDISYRQLTNMKATQLLLCGTRSIWLTASDMLYFYKMKLKEWLQAPDTEFHYDFGSIENFENPPYLDFRRLLMDVREQLESPDFRVYPNYRLSHLYDSVRGKCLTIRSKKFGICLHIRDGSFWTGDPDKYQYPPSERVWPETHGFDF